MDNSMVIAGWERKVRWRSMGEYVVDGKIKMKGKKKNLRHKIILMLRMTQN